MGKLFGKYGYFGEYGKRADKKSHKYFMKHREASMIERQYDLLKAIREARSQGERIVKYYVSTWDGGVFERITVEDAETIAKTLEEEYSKKYYRVERDGQNLLIELEAEDAYKEAPLANDCFEIASKKASSELVKLIRRTNCQIKEAAVDGRFQVKMTVDSYFQKYFTDFYAQRGYEINVSDRVVTIDWCMKKNIGLED